MVDWRLQWGESVACHATYEFVSVGIVVNEFDGIHLNTSIAGFGIVGIGL